jgi:hypothetical protein
LAQVERINRRKSTLRFFTLERLLANRGESAMKRSQFSEQQIAFILHQAEEGVAVEEACRKAGISAAALHAPHSTVAADLAWKARDAPKQSRRRRSNPLSPC